MRDDEELLAYIRGHSDVSTSRIRLLMDSGADVADNAIRRLMKRGEIIRVRQGYYRAVEE